MATQGFIFEFSPSSANIESNIPPPEIYDQYFTQELYNNLVADEYYKVYWQIFNGTDYVKSLT